MVKSEGGQRESDGVVVPLIGVRNAPGGKGPDFEWRLRGLMVKKRGRNLRPGQVQQWDEDWFNGHGLHRLRGTIRYPKAA